MAGLELFNKPVLDLLSQQVRVGNGLFQLLGLQILRSLEISCILYNTTVGWKRSRRLLLLVKSWSLPWGTLSVEPPASCLWRCQWSGSGGERWPGNELQSCSVGSHRSGGKTSSFSSPSSSRWEPSLTGMTAWSLSPRWTSGASLSSGSGTFSSSAPGQSQTSRSAPAQKEGYESRGMICRKS